MDFVIGRAMDSDSREVPVAAAVVRNGEIISSATNAVESYGIPWNHAEFLAISDALKKLNSRYLDDSSIYITLEPCAFCAALLEKVRIKDIFFGAYDPKCGAIAHNIKLFESSLIKPNIIGGIQEERCSILLKNFFNNLRTQK
ncbi:MAG: nucleoside deaminase [Holosporales bacterium]|jgi:tRNA(Arg) A34 adenosine deaminase TadA|nr:nucleoside deaminase [Holosporales bacterium]